MKGLKYIWLLFVALMTTGLVACNDDDNNGSQSAPIKVSKIYLEDYQSSVPDREVEFARLGQLIRIEGEGFLGLKKLYINGYDTYFNVAYVTDKSMLVTLSSSIPVIDAEDDVRNTLRFVKDKTETTYSFTIRAASPSITSVSNTLPQVGELVFVYGNNLHETTKITLPGGIEVTDITSDSEGKWYSFVMPSGVTEAGSITSEGANGTAKTPEYFNNRNCMVLDFDGNGNQGYWSWTDAGSMVNDEDLVDDPLGTGRGKCFQVIPERLIEAGIAAGKSRATECWTAGNGDDLDDWTRMTEYIPATTALTDVAFQFDVYVPEEGWDTTGQIEIVLFNNFNLGGYNSDDNNSGNPVAFYIPWVVNGENTTFKTNGWQTVTIPFSEFVKYAELIADAESTDPTFQMVIDDRNAATYKNFGIGFVNTDFVFDGFTCTATVAKPRIYLDNWRVVPCASISVSDFDDEEEE